MQNQDVPTKVLMKTTLIANLLEDFLKQGHLKGAAPWKHMQPHAHYSEKQLVKNTLELHEYVMDETEKQDLTNGQLLGKELKS